MARLDDDLKSHWEDQTLGIFAWFRRDSGGPDYELVERGERPDRRIREKGEEEVIGVEITRIVVGRDAGQRRFSYYFSDEMSVVLSQYAKGGHVYLYSGAYPDLSRKGRDRLCERLKSEIDAADGIGPFVDGLRSGMWTFERTVFHIDKVGEREGWAFHNNAVQPTWSSDLPQDELDSVLLDRLRDKAGKAPSYEWEGRLALLVRNPYQPYCPSPATLKAAEELMEGAFDEAWLVNHKEGTVDLSPPEPRLVQLT